MKLCLPLPIPQDLSSDPNILIPYPSQPAKQANPKALKTNGTPIRAKATPSENLGKEETPAKTLVPSPEPEKDRPTPPHSLLVYFPMIPKKISSNPKVSMGMGVVVGSWGQHPRGCNRKPL
ncbi:hypothetical protein DSO57_1020743 [Entomophthora muscae]|uniref:Uncharacterized protein n=1 Tax=Entomophthora muscae TaxID=34485 RepID=A0ACC2RIF6_9FUNG|nr:hypothetical protein DSO57_1020743 [Entomophthora muscae]